jgi:hypothetical protein
VFQTFTKLSIVIRAFEKCEADPDIPASNGEQAAEPQGKSLDCSNYHRYILLYGDFVVEID